MPLIATLTIFRNITRTLESSTKRKKKKEQKRTCCHYKMCPLPSLNKTLGGGLTSSWPPNKQVTARNNIKEPCSSYYVPVKGMRTFGRRKEPEGSQRIRQPAKQTGSSPFRQIGRQMGGAGDILFGAQFCAFQLDHFPRCGHKCHFFGIPARR